MGLSYGKKSFSCNSFLYLSSVLLPFYSLFLFTICSPSSTRAFVPVLLLLCTSLLHTIKKIRHCKYNAFFHLTYAEHEWLNGEDESATQVVQSSIKQTWFIHWMKVF